MTGNKSKSDTNSSNSGFTKTTTAQYDTIQPPKRIVQNYLLIWVDARIDQSNHDCQNTLTQLRNIVDNVNIFTKPDQCIDFLNKIKDEKAFVIVSGTLGEHLVSNIHQMSQVDAIYIFSDNKSRHEEWIKEWPKVNGVHTKITLICQALQVAVKQCNQNSIGISFIMVNEVLSDQNLDQKTFYFMFTKILKKIVLEIEYDNKSIKNFVLYCREKYIGNSGELSAINDFADNYRPQYAIWWYTRECFTYQMLNRALRTLDVDTIINFGFFIRDLHRQIEKLHQKQIGSYRGKLFTVYRGQGLLTIDFEKLTQTRGELMSFNNFLSTSRRREVSLGFAQDTLTNSETIGVLFQMVIDPSIASSSFAVVDDVSYFNKEEEILFSIHTVFRIGEIKKINNNNRLYQVDLKLVGNDDQQLRTLTRRIQKQTNGTGWSRMSQLLIGVSQFDKAEELYTVLLDQTSDEREKLTYYNNLGSIKTSQGNPREAVLFLEKAAVIQEKILSPNHPDLAVSYAIIGFAHMNIDEYSKALSFYGKVVDIYENNLPTNDYELATSYNNIGEVYRNMGEYTKALLFHEKVVKIYEKTLPLKHTLLATTYNNISLVYMNMNDYSKAVSFCEKALTVQEKTLSPNHLDFATTYNNIGLLYYNMDEYTKALSFHRKAIQIYENNLSSDDALLAASYCNISLVHMNMNEYLTALSFCKKAVAIQKKTLPRNHLDFATTYYNMGLVYYLREEYSKALSSLERSLDIWQHSLPLNHSSIQIVREMIEDVQETADNYF